MAKIAVTALDLELPTGTDISSEIMSANLDINVDALDTTDFASGGYRERIGGLKDYTLNFTMHPDAANTNLNTIFNTNLGAVLAFSCQVDGGSADSPANAEVTGSVLINQVQYGGAVGDIHAVNVSLPGSGALTFTTA